MHEFDYSFLKNISLPCDIANYFGCIYDGSGREKLLKEKYPSIFKKLEKISEFNSVKDSNAIEGIFSSDKRIEQIISGSLDPANLDEQEIKGYKVTLDEINNDHLELDFRERDVLHLYERLLEFTDFDYKGQYKTKDNYIVNSHGDIVWLPIKSLDTPKAMKELYKAFIIARSDSDINLLLLIPCAMFDFLCIHPFTDGNGRMTRLLTNLLLYQVGFDIQKYISLESVISKYNDLYNKAFRESSVGWNENKNNYLPVIKNFMMNLAVCFKELDRRFSVVQSGKGAKQKEIEDLVMQSLVPISKEQICSLLFNVSPHTVSAVLYNLLEEGKIIRIGNTKGAKYINKELGDRYK